MFDVAILDMQMSAMDGLTLAHTIKSDTDIRSTRLLMLTSLGQREDCEALRRTGIARCLGKPVKQSQLFDALAIIMADEIDAPNLAIPVHITSLGQKAVLPELAPRGGGTEQTRILVAEDNLVNQKVALIQLQNLGYAADVVVNGREALEALTRFPYPIVLMDCQMPEMDGYEATANIRRDEEGLSRRTVIIAMTAHALEGEREKCLDAGMDDYLSKPVKSDVLRLKLERWTKPVGRSGKGSHAGSEPALHARTSVIDQAQLASLRAIQQPGEPDFVTELIDLFLHEAASDFQVLRDALLRVDALEIQRVAHRLKGSSANMGATQMAALSEELESKDPAKDASELLAQLENEFELVREALKAERKGNRRMNILIAPLSAENRKRALRVRCMILPCNGVTVMPDSPGQHEPVTVSLDVVWQGSSGKQDARMSEISMDGCFIDSRVQGRALGDIVEFKVHLPSGPWVSLQGELVNEDYPIGFGLRFRGLTDGDKRLLAQVVVAHGGDPGELQPSPAVVEVKTPAQIPAGRRRVLIADDDALTLRMVTAIVETEGYQAVSVADGRQALRFLQQDATFSAAIFDMMMPHLQGLDLILYMKADERLRRILKRNGLLGPELKLAVLEHFGFRQNLAARHPPNVLEDTRPYFIDGLRGINDAAGGKIEVARHAFENRRV